MNITGIIVEYNPFHNGHIYHLNKAKELTKPDLTIAVMSGNYTQRGDLSIIDKFVKTEAALRNGVDLVVELPYIFTVQNAYVFGNEAVNILNKLHVNNIVFGSETNNLDELSKYADLQVDVTRLKELLNDGFSYPKAYGLLSGSMYPNDILAVTYLKAIKETNIKPYLIKRTNEYHSKDIKEISSASAIRNNIKNNKEDYKQSTPISIEKPVFIDMLYPYIRNLLITLPKEELNSIFLVNEGIENLLVKNANIYSNYDDFIKASISKRYTKSRIQRILCHLINHITKKDVVDIKNNYIRILGFNKKGQDYLNEIKKEDINLVTQFKNLPEKVKEIEWKTSVVYSSVYDKNYLTKELKGPIILK